MAKTDPQWDRIAASAEFKDLLKSKAKFVVPATIISRCLFRSDIFRNSCPARYGGP